MPKRIGVQFASASPAGFEVPIQQGQGTPANAAFSQKAVKKVPAPGKLTNFIFYLGAPAARQVNLAADFTQWDKSPVTMTRRADGLWHAKVPLPPGRYAYRFMVDGQWSGNSHLLEKRADASGPVVRIHV